MDKYIADLGLKATVKRDPFKVLFERLGEPYKRYREMWTVPSLENYQKDFPLHLDMDLSDACNMRCPLCHQNYRERANRRVTREMLDRLFDEAGNYNLCAVNFGASGEPSLEMEMLFYGIKRAHESGVMEIFVHTNGLLLDEAFAAKLLDSPVTHVCISLDAATPETYEACRGLKALPIIEKNVLNLIAAREKAGAVLPTIRVSFCNNPANTGEREAFIEKWKDVADMVEVQNYRDVEGNMEVSEGAVDVTFECIEPFRRAMVWPDGKVSLCCAFANDDVVMGSLHDSTMHEIWTSERFVAVRKAFSAKKGMPGSCVRCLQSNYALG